MMRVQNWFFWWRMWSSERLREQPEGTQTSHCQGLASLDWCSDQIFELDLSLCPPHKDTPFLDKKMHLDVFLLSKYILVFVILIIGFNIYSLCHWAFYIFFSINWGFKFNAPLASFQLWSLNCFCCNFSPFSPAKVTSAGFPKFHGILPPILCSKWHLLISRW